MIEQILRNILNRIVGSSSTKRVPFLGKFSHSLQQDGDHCVVEILSHRHSLQVLVLWLTKRGTSLIYLSFMCDLIYSIVSKETIGWVWDKRDLGGK